MAAFLAAQLAVVVLLFVLVAAFEQGLALELQLVLAVVFVEQAQIEPKLAAAELAVHLLFGS